MNPISRMAAWLRGVFSRRDDRDQHDAQFDADDLAAAYFGVIGSFVETHSPIIELAKSDMPGYDLVRVASVSHEYITYQALSEHGFTTGAVHVRMLASIPDVRLDSPALVRLRLKRAWNISDEPEEEPDDEDSNDEDLARVE